MRDLHANLYLLKPYKTNYGNKKKYSIPDIK